MTKKPSISILVSAGSGANGLKNLLAHLETLTRLYQVHVIVCNNALKSDFSAAWKIIQKQGWGYFLSKRKLSAPVYREWCHQKWADHPADYNFFLHSGLTLPQHFFASAIKTWGKLSPDKLGALNLVGEAEAKDILPQPVVALENAGKLDHCYMVSEQYLREWPNIKNLATYRVARSLVDRTVPAPKKKPKPKPQTAPKVTPTVKPSPRQTKPTRSKRAAFFVATTHRPKLLEACLKRLQQQTVPAGWDYEILVGGEPTDAGKGLVQKMERVRYVEVTSQTVTSKLNAILQAAGPTVDLVLLADDDDIQPIGRLAAACRAHDEGAHWSGVAEVLFYALAEDRVMRWTGRAEQGLIGTSISFAGEHLRKVGGWPERARGKDGPMAAAFRKGMNTRPVFKDITKEIDLIVCLQHADNIWNRAVLEREGRSRKGSFEIIGQGSLDDAEDIPEDMRKLLKSLRGDQPPVPVEEAPSRIGRKPMRDSVRKWKNRHPQKPPEVIPEPAPPPLHPDLQRDISRMVTAAPIDCSVILGTVNRPEMLKECVASVRESLKDSDYTYEIVIAYGDESDTSMTWMKEQSDIRPILGGMEGAIPAFNRAYEASKGRFICQINDDIIIEGKSIANAIRHLDSDPTLGAVAFHMSRDRGKTYMKMDFPQAPGLPHPNQVVARREMCEDIIAEGFGAFWGDENTRTHHTYGGDSAWGLRGHRLGWKMERKPDVTLIDLVNETLDDPNREANSTRLNKHRDAWHKKYNKKYARPITRDPMGWPNVYNPKRGMPHRRSPIEAGPPERVLHVSLAGSHEAQHGHCLALARMGPYQTIRWNERRQKVGLNRMYEEVYELIRTHQPTLIWMQVQGNRAFNSGIIRQMRKLAPPNCLIVSWTGDVRTDIDEPVEAWQADQCKELDLFLSSECTYAEKLREMGVRAKTGHHIIGTDTTVNGPRQGNPKDWKAAGKACFTGSPHTGFHKGPGVAPRVQMALDIEKALPGMYVCYGHSWNKLRQPILSHPFIARARRAELHSVARVVVVQSLFQKLRRYTSDRLPDSLITKGFCAVQYFDDMEGYGLQDGVNCVIWKDNEELVELLRDWLRPERDADRAVIQQAGYELARDHWTWDVAMEQLLAIVREERRQRGLALPTGNHETVSIPEVDIVEPTPPQKELKLHIACGDKHIKGYINTDLRPGPAVDQVLDAHEALPSAAYSEIYACHVLEHFYAEETLDILRNWHQALRPGGILRVAVPDLRLIVANCVESHKFGKDPNAPLFGDFRKAAEEPDRHKQTFVKESLTKLLIAAGFKDIKEWKSNEVPEIKAVRDWSSYDTVSLNLLGIKR